MNPKPPTRRIGRNRVAAGLLWSAAMIVGGSNLVAVLPAESESGVRAGVPPSASRTKASPPTASLPHPAGLTDRLPNTTTTSISMFYNIFLPATNYARALEIVGEQLGLIRDSYAGAQNLTVYYNTMGALVSPPIVGNGRSSTTSATSVDAIGASCRRNGVSCRHLGHYEEGDEVHTLQAMYDHCQSLPPPSTGALPNPNRVAYLHNKGSFHDTPENAKLRIPLTRAVGHPDCWEPPDPSCNSCGLVFLDLPFPTMPGNFFVADCSYLRKLIPPKEFEPRMRHLVEGLHHNNHTSTEALGSFPSALKDRLLEEVSWRDTPVALAERPSWLGLDRYASEHWAHSHPAVVPCDLSQRLKVWFRPKPQPMRWKMYPRPALSDRARNQPDVDFGGGYFGIAGQLYKWSGLYPGEWPSPASWVWDRYPSGASWREALYLTLEGARNGRAQD